MKPRTMRVAILGKLEKPLVIAEAQLRETPDLGQVLVTVHYSGICGSQLGEIDGAKGDKFLPHLLGYEGSATVREVGPGVRHVKPGDRVVGDWRKKLGIESVTPKSRWDGTIVNAGVVTSFNEYAMVSENRLTTTPADSDVEVATLVGGALTTGFGVVVNNAKLKTGEPRLAEKLAASVLGPRYRDFLDQWNVPLDPCVNWAGRELSAQEAFDLAAGYKASGQTEIAKRLLRKSSRNSRDTARRTIGLG